MEELTPLEKMDLRLRTLEHRISQMDEHPYSLKEKMNDYEMTVRFRTHEELLAFIERRFREQKGER